MAMVGLSCSKTENCYRIDGKAERTAIDSIFVGSIIRKAIDVLGRVKHCTQHGPLETHVVVGVFGLTTACLAAIRRGIGM